MTNTLCTKVLLLCMHSDRAAVTLETLHRTSAFITTMLMMQRASRLLSRRSMSSTTPTRSMSSTTPTKLKGHAPRIVAHVVGPDRVGILSSVTRIITENGGKVHDTRATNLGGTFAVTTEIDFPGNVDSSAVGFAREEEKEEEEA